MARASFGRMTRSVPAPRLRPFSPLSAIEKLLSMKPYSASWKKLANRVRSLGRDERRYLLWLCEKAIREPSVVGNGRLRLSVAKVLVALVPQSLAVIERLLQRANDHNLHELHFSLFCFLDRVPELSDGRNFAKELSRLVEKYLLTVKYETAQAAWMAGDLLGDHWDPREAIRILMKVVRQGRFSAGRKGALHGLGHALDKVGSKETSAILSVICDVSQSDRSEDVKSYARLLLSRGGCGSLT